MTILRELKIPISIRNSFFLWGPRQAGKTFYLRKTFPYAIYIDLLNSTEFIKYIGSIARDAANIFMPLLYIIILLALFKLNSTNKIISFKKNTFSIGNFYNLFII